MLLSIVIVNWNVAELLKNCIDSLESNLRDVEHEIIVVDNASSDNSVSMIREQYPWVTLIANKNNEGFARGNNQGFKIAKGKYILMLNPDTIIKDNSIQLMVDVLDKNPGVGMTGPRIVDENGKVTPPCRRPSPTITNIFLKRFLIDKVASEVIAVLPTFESFWNRKFFTNGFCDCIQGACMLVRRDDLNRVGYFDESVPMYLDDIDLCYRLIKIGLKVYFCADAEIIHICGASTRRSANPKAVDLVVCKAVDTFFLKHKTLFHVVIYHILIFISSILFLIIDLLILPVMYFVNRRHILSLIDKHFGALVYSFLFKLNVKNFKGYVKKPV